MVTPETLLAALKGAKPGDVLALAPGDYRGVRLSGLTGLTVTAADPKDRPRFIGGVIINKAAGLCLSGVNFELGPIEVASASIVTVSGGEDIVVTDCDFLGYERGDGARFGRGLVASGVKGLRIVGNRFSRVFRGVVVAGTSGPVIEDNDMFDLGSDGINLGQVEGARVSANQIVGFKPAAGDHPDGIQIMTAAGGPSRDVEISGNLIVGQGAQGIFVKAENKAVRHQGIAIRGNIVVDAGFHAITAGQSDGVVIEGNTCLFRPRDDADMSWIKTEAGAVVRGNKAMRYLLAPADEKAAEAVNEVIGLATDAETEAAIAAWRKAWRPEVVQPEPAPADPQVIEITLKPGQRLIVTGAA